MRFPCKADIPDEGTFPHACMCGRPLLPLLVRSGIIEPLPQSGGFEADDALGWRGGPLGIEYERAPKDALVCLATGIHRLIDVEGDLLPVGGNRGSRGRVEVRRTGREGVVSDRILG